MPISNSRKLAQELDNLMSIIEMKNLYKYKGGLCSVERPRGQRKIVRIEHSSLREFVWAYVSKPKDANRVLKMLEDRLVDFSRVRKNRIKRRRSRKCKQAKLQSAKESVRQRFNRAESAEDVDRVVFKRSETITQETVDAYNLKFYPLSLSFSRFLTGNEQIGQLHITRPSLFLKIKDYINRRCAVMYPEKLIIPNGEFCDFLPPDLEAPFRYQDICKIVTYQIELGELPPLIEPVDYSTASMEITSEETVKTHSVTSFVNALFGYLPSKKEIIDELTCKDSTSKPESELTCKESEATVEFDFIQGFDAPGNDIKRVTEFETFEDLKEIAKNTPGCVGFNTNGWLKSKINLYDGIKSDTQFESKGGLYVVKGEGEPIIYEKDIELVMAQTGCDRQHTLQALARSDWDIVNAVMSLQF